MSYIQHVLEDDKFEKEILKAGHLLEDDVKQAQGWFNFYYVAFSRNVLSFFTYFLIIYQFFSRTFLVSLQWESLLV